MSVRSVNVEDIVINRITKKEMLQNGMERLKRKVCLIEKSLEHLEDCEQAVIENLILYPGELEYRKLQVLVGVRSKEELMKLKRKALLRFYRRLRLQEAERKQKKDQYQEAINFMKKQQEKERLQKEQRQLFIQSIKDKHKMLS